MNNIIYMLRGLPASGKTTLARGMVEKGNVKRVNKDDLRLMLDNGQYTPENEAFVRRIHSMIVQHALRCGYDVIVDDTNFNPDHEAALRELGGHFDAEVKVIEVDTPLDECIRRDAVRANPVGEKVIRDMWEKYVRDQHVAAKMDEVWGKIAGMDWVISTNEEGP